MIGIVCSLRARRSGTGLLPDILHRFGGVCVHRIDLVLHLADRRPGNLADTGADIRRGARSGCGLLRGDIGSLLCGMLGGCVHDGGWQVNGAGLIRPGLRLDTF